MQEIPWYKNPEAIRNIGFVCFDRETSESICRNFNLSTNGKIDKYLINNHPDVLFSFETI
jgi:hypothetical protein